MSIYISTILLLKDQLNRLFASYYKNDSNLVSNSPSIQSSIKYREKEYIKF